VAKRPAARVVLLNRDREVFLISASDPLDPYAPEWWEIPGGGVDRRENPAVAAERELYEETGIADVEMGPCVWTQQVQFTFGGYFFDSDEKIYVAWCDGGEWNPQGLEALERDAFSGAKWWPVEEVANSSEKFLPERMPEFLVAIADGHLPSEPIDISPLT
jgi:8-oxo-dGTP pyrophosphatase MutT (NUDIX family)